MMKIVAGMGSIDDFESFAKQGTDEIYIGYVPNGWYEKYGNTIPLNRREVRYVNVQAGSFSEIEILSRIAEKYGVKVTVTLNSLFYNPGCFDDIIGIIEKCKSVGIHSFIIADSALLVRIKAQGINDIDIHLSGEFGESNTYSSLFADKMNVKRIIFNRKTPIEDMRNIIKQNSENGLSFTEYEAFALNEMCHFSGGFCNSVHCDEFAHMCLVPYRMQGIEIKDDCFSDACDTGCSGCGLCALWKLEKRGITHLKIVSRGALSENALSDIKALKTALTILENSHNESEYIAEMKKVIFPVGCSHNCYYR